MTELEMFKESLRKTLIEENERLPLPVSVRTKGDNQVQKVLDRIGGKLLNDTSSPVRGCGTCQRPHTTGCSSYYAEECGINYLNWIG